MIALILALLTFCAFAIIGAGLLAVVGADLRELRIALTAPAVGTAVLMVPMFVVSRIGIRMDRGGPAVAWTLLALASVRQPPWSAFMPLILAFNMCTICATGALALQAARHWWAAPLAAALLTISPLATYGVLAQLLPQVWALGLAAALFAILMREDV